MIRALSAAALTLIALASGCGQPEAEGDPKLTIYVSAPLTGPAGPEGRDAADGARLALADAEGEAGGIAVEAEYLDVAGRNESRSDPVSAGRNARTATEDSTSIAYIGELDSAASRTSVPITNSAGILQVAPGSGATDLVVEETFDDSVPEDVQATGERTFARVLPSDEDVQEAVRRPETSSPARARPRSCRRRRRRCSTGSSDEFDREPGPWAAYGYEAMASALAAIDRADDPLSRSSVVAAYFDGTERDSVLGTVLDHRAKARRRSTSRSALTGLPAMDGSCPGAGGPAGLTDGLLIYNQMVVDVTQASPDDVFQALADPTRRDILQRSAVRRISVSRLADGYPMRFAAVQKHVAVLERAGLVDEGAPRARAARRTDPKASPRRGRLSTTSRRPGAAASSEWLTS